MHPRHKSWKGSAFSGPKLRGKFLSKNLIHFYRVSQKNYFQNAVEAQKSLKIVMKTSLICSVSTSSFSFFNPIRSCHVFAYISENTRTCALKNLTFPNYKFGKGYYAFHSIKLYCFAGKNKVCRKYELGWRPLQAMKNYKSPSFSGWVVVI